MTDKESPAFKFWSEVYVESIMEQGPFEHDGAEEFVAEVSRRLDIPVAPLKRWGVGTDQDYELPPLNVATRLAVNLGISLAKVRDIYGQQEIPIPPTVPTLRLVSGSQTGGAMTDEARRHSERFRQVSNRYPRRVAETYDGDIRAAAADSDEQVAARVTAWEQSQGLLPRDWYAIGQKEKEGKMS